MDNGEILKAACDEVLADPALRPVYDKAGKLLTTFCNVGVGRVAARCSCPELDSTTMTAEKMIEHVRANVSGRWTIVDGRAAALHALSGGFALAFMDMAKLGEPHAHVAAVAPQGMQPSGSLAKDVPIVANVGKGDPAAPLINAGDGKKTKPNWYCKSSAAFPTARGEAEYAIWA